MFKKYSSLSVPLKSRSLRFDRFPSCCYNNTGNKLFHKYMDRDASWQLHKFGSHSILRIDDAFGTLFDTMI